MAWKRLRGALAVLAALMVGIIVIVPSSPGPGETILFTHRGVTVAGRLHRPAGPGPHPAVLFVHGDGAMPWDAHGYYRPIMGALHDAGFATVSWDKPGVGDSQGDWLTHGMSDRAAIVRAAARALRQRPDIDADRIGLLGFSQAGWVMPRAMRDDTRLAFMVAISPAINWVDQGRHLATNRMTMEGCAAPEIAAALAFQHRALAHLGPNARYDDYVAFMCAAPACIGAVLSPVRWAFVSKNVHSDAREDLRVLRAPVLAVWGALDLKVDPWTSAAVYEADLRRPGGHADVTTVVLPRADHALLPTDVPRLVTSHAALIWRLLTIEVLGEAAFAPGFIPLVSGWLADRFGPDARPDAGSPR